MENKSNDFKQFFSIFKGVKNHSAKATTKHNSLSERWRAYIHCKHGGRTAKRHRLDQLWLPRLRHF
jgi:hypothetical protein